MTTINDTVTQAMNQNGLRQYTGQAEPVVAALVQREQQIYTGIVDKGVAMGADRGQVEQALADLGLHAPTAAAAGAGDDGDLNDKVARLEAFARRHGFAG